MMNALQTPTELHAGDATVKIRLDGLGYRLEVRTGDEPAAAHAAALLVRQVVLDGARTGVRSVALTLDVSSPACGAVLAQLHDLARAGRAALRLRRAGETVLVDVDLRPVCPEDDHVLAAAATTPAAARHADRRQAAWTQPAHRDRRPDPTISTARRAQRRLRAQLAGRSGVCGVGLARKGDGYALRVNVVDTGVDVPAEVDGLPVDVCVTGPLTAQPDEC